MLMVMTVIDCAMIQAEPTVWCVGEVSDTLGWLRVEAQDQGGGRRRGQKKKAKASTGKGFETRV